MRVLRDTLNAYATIDGLSRVLAAARNAIPGDANIVEIDLEDLPSPSLASHARNRISMTFEWPAPKTEEEMIHGD